MHCVGRGQVGGMGLIFSIPSLSFSSRFISPLHLSLPLPLPLFLLNHPFISYPFHSFPLCLYFYFPCICFPKSILFLLNSFLSSVFYTFTFFIQFFNSPISLFFSRLLFKPHEILCSSLLLLYYYSLHLTLYSAPFFSPCFHNFHIFTLSLSSRFSTVTFSCLLFPFCLFTFLLVNNFSISLYSCFIPSPRLLFLFPFLASGFQIYVNNFCMPLPPSHPRSTLPYVCLICFLNSFHPLLASFLSFFLSFTVYLSLFHYAQSSTSFSGLAFSGFCTQQAFLSVAI